MFSAFAQVETISPETISRHEAHVPSEIAQVWREHGTGFLGDGFVRVIDPDRALTMLDGVIGLADGAVPVLTTGLADLFVSIGDALHLVRFRFSTIEGLTTNAAELLRDLEDEDFLDHALARQPYPQAAARLGVPGLDQCFGCAPLLALGGNPDPGNLHLGGLWEHLAIAVHLTGTPRPRPTV
jgi:hypothetical protein